MSTYNGNMSQPGLGQYFIYFIIFCVFGLMAMIFIGNTLGSGAIEDIIVTEPVQSSISSAEYQDNILAFSGYSDNSESHAEKHGMDYQLIQDCLNNGGSIQTWKKTLSNGEQREMEVCLMPDGTFGLKIDKLKKGVWKNVTAFIKDGINGPMTSLQELEQYLINSDWTCLVGCQ